MYANLTNSHRDTVRKSSDTRVIKRIQISSSSGVIVQRTTTTEETWTGLSKTDALALCTSSETSVLGGETRDYLGAAKLTVSTSGISMWATEENCWGTKISSNIQRMNDTNLYQVSRTTVEMEVYNSGGTMEKL